MSESSPQSPKLRHRLEAFAARALFAGLRLLPTPLASAFGGFLARSVGPLTPAHRIAQRNLAQALPTLDAKARAKVLRGAWGNFGRTMVEYALLARLGRTGEDRVAVEGHEALAAVPEGRPVLLFCAHLANWEVIPLALSGLSKPLTIVYRAANNPLVDALIARARAPFIGAMLPKGGSGARQLVKALGAGEHVIMVVDQKLNTGLEVPFFGRGAFTSPALIMFAQRHGCPVFPVRTERLPGCRFKVVVEPPWHFPDGGDEALGSGLVQLNQRLETWIRARPDQWLWMHKRWPD
jgi:KDO2-lipid IV(A) lauroyltransferase